MGLDVSRSVRITIISMRQYEGVHWQLLLLWSVHCSHLPFARVLASGRPLQASSCPAPGCPPRSSPPASSLANCALSEPQGRRRSRRSTSTRRDITVLCARVDSAYPVPAWKGGVRREQRTCRIAAARPRSRVRTGNCDGHSKQEQRQQRECAHYHRRAVTLS